MTAFEKKYDECFAVQEEYFAGEIDKTDARTKLRPIEAEVDKMVNRLYGIEAKEEMEVDDTDKEREEREVPVGTKVDEVGGKGRELGKERLVVEGIEDKEEEEEDDEN